MYFYRLLTLLLLLISNTYINSQTPCGFFTQVTGSPFTAGIVPDSVAYSPLIGTNTLFAAVTNHNSFTVSVYSADTNTGVLTQVSGSPFATGLAPESVAFSPLIGTNTLYAAVANSGSFNVSVYSVNTNTGVFTQVTGSPFGAGGFPSAVAFSPLLGANILYAAVTNSNDSTVSVYSVDTSTGAFTQIGGSPFATGSGPKSIAFSPLIGTDTLYAAVANSNGGTVSVYSVNTSTGAFTQIGGSPFATGSGPQSIAFSPLIGTNTLYAAVANQNDGTVSVYSVNTNTGVFTQVTRSPFAAGNESVSVAFSPLIGANTLYAAVANFNDDAVSLYSVDITTGVFTEVTGSPFAIVDRPFSVAFSPLIGTNLFAAVANAGSNSAAVFRVDLPIGQLKAAPNTIKLGEFSELTLSITGFGPFTVEWSDGTTQTGNSPIKRIVQPTETTTFSARVTDINGCTADSNAVTIEVESPVPPPPPLIITASLRVDPKCICPGGSSLLKLKITGGTPPFTIRWPDGKVTRKRKRTAFHKFSTQQDRSVRVSVVDSNGTSISSNIVTIKVFPNCCRRSTKKRGIKPCRH